MLQVANQPGPFYCFLRPLVFELMRRGLDVDVACNRLDPRFEQLSAAGMKTIPLTVGPWRSPKTWLTLRRELREVLRRKRYDICVVHTPAISWLTRREAARAGIPVVVYTAHGLPFFARQGRLVYRALLAVEKRCARYTDLLLVMNQDDYKAALSQVLVKPGGVIRRIPGVGIDVGRWQASPSAAEVGVLRAELGLRPETRLLLYLGRLMASKGVLDLVEILVTLARTEHDVALLVAGDGPLEAAMRRRAAERGVAERLRLLGWRDDVVRLMHAADVLLLPSTYREGLPFVLLEAGAAGKPVVAYRNRGANDVVVDGQTGFLVAAGPGAPPALAGAVARLLDDCELARRLGEAGRRRVAQEFSYAQAVRAQLEAYADVLERKGYDVSMLRGEPGEPRFSLASLPASAAGGQGAPESGPAGGGQGP